MAINQDQWEFTEWLHTPEGGWFPFTEDLQPSKYFISKDTVYYFETKRRD